METMELSNKVVEWAKFTQKNSQKKSVVGTMDGRRGSKPSFPNWKLKHFMDSKHKNCVTCITWG